MAGDGQFELRLILNLREAESALTQFQSRMRSAAASGSKIASQPAGAARTAAVSKATTELAQERGKLLGGLRQAVGTGVITQADYKALKAVIDRETKARQRQLQGLEGYDAKKYQAEVTRASNAQVKALQAAAAAQAEVATASKTQARATKESGAKVKKAGDDLAKAHDDAARLVRKNTAFEQAANRRRQGTQGDPKAFIGTAGRTTDPLLLAEQMRTATKKELEAATAVTGQKLGLGVQEAAAAEILRRENKRATAASGQQAAADVEHVTATKQSARAKKKAADRAFTPNAAFDRAFDQGRVEFGPDEQVIAANRAQATSAERVAAAAKREEAQVERVVKAVQTKAQIYEQQVAAAAAVGKTIPLMGGRTALPRPTTEQLLRTSKADLYRQAQAANLPGRSKMSRTELYEALNALPGQRGRREELGEFGTRAETVPTGDTAAKIRAAQQRRLKGEQDAAAAFTADAKSRYSIIGGGTPRKLAAAEKLSAEALQEDARFRQLTTQRQRAAFLASLPKGTVVADDLARGVRRIVEPDTVETLRGADGAVTGHRRTAGRILEGRIRQATAAEAAGDAEAEAAAAIKETSRAAKVAARREVLRGQRQELAAKAEDAAQQEIAKLRGEGKELTSRDMARIRATARRDFGADPRRGRAGEEEAGRTKAQRELDTYVKQEYAKERAAIKEQRNAANLARQRDRDTGREQRRIDKTETVFPVDSFGAHLSPEEQFLVDRRRAQARAAAAAPRVPVEEPSVAEQKARAAAAQARAIEETRKVRTRRVTPTGDEEAARAEASAALSGKTVAEVAAAKVARKRRQEAQEAKAGAEVVAATQEEAVAARASARRKRVAAPTQAIAGWDVGATGNAAQAARMLAAQREAALRGVGRIGPSTGQASHWDDRVNNPPVTYGKPGTMNRLVQDEEKLGAAVKAAATSAVQGAAAQARVTGATQRTARVAENSAEVARRRAAETRAKADAARDPEVIAARDDLARANAEQTRRQQEARRAERAAQTSPQRAAQAQRDAEDRLERDRRRGANFGADTPANAEASGRAARAKQLAALNSQAVKQAQIASQSDQQLRHQAQITLATRENERLAQKAVLDEARRQGLLKKGTLIQQVQSHRDASRGQFVDPRTQLTAGGLFSRQLSQTAGFAVAGGGIYAVFSQVSQAVDEAVKLEEQLSLIKAQFNSLGEAGGFNEFRDGILTIARDTGQLASDITQIAPHIKGAFSDNSEALAATRTAVELAAISGGSFQDVANNLIATGKAYGVTGHNLAEVSDAAFGAFKRYGAPIEETTKAVGLLAQTGDFAGFSIEKLTNLLGKVAEESGQSASTVAERLQRILPLITTKGAALVKIAQTEEALRGKLTAATFDQGPEAVLDVLGSNFEGLSASGQEAILNVLGSGRGAASLLPIFQNYADILRNVDAAAEDAGSAHKAFEEQQKTLAAQIRILREQFNQTVQAFLNSGLLEGFTFILDKMEFVLKAFGTFDDLLGGIPIKLALILTGIKLIDIAVAKATGQGFLTALTARGAAGAVAGGAGAAVPGQFLYGAGGAAAGGTAAGGIRGLLGKGPKLGAGGAIGIGVLGAAVVAQSYADNRGKVDTEAEKFAATLSTATDRQVAEIANQQRSLLDNIKGFFQFDIPQDLAQAEQRKRKVLLDQASRALSFEFGLHGEGEQDFGGGVKGPSELKVRRGKHPSLAASAKDLLESTDVDAINAAAERFEEVDALYDEGALSPENRLKIEAIRKRVSEAIATGEIKNYDEMLRVIKGLPAQEADPAASAADKAAEVVQELENVKSMYEAGQTTFASYLDALSADIAIQTDLAKSTNQDISEPARKQLADDLKNQSEAIANQARNRAKLATDIAGLGSSSKIETGQAEIGILTAALEDPKMTDQSVRFGLSMDLISAVKKHANDVYNSAADGAAKEAAAMGQPIPEVARAQIIRAQLDAQAIQLQALFGTLMGGNQGAVSGLLDAVARKVAAGLSIVDAINQVIDDTIRAVLAALDRANAAFDAAAARANQDPNTTNDGPLIRAGQRRNQAEKDAADAKARADAARTGAPSAAAQAGAVGVPKVAKPDIDPKAAADKAKAEAKALRDAQYAVIQANRAMFEAIHEANPVVIGLSHIAAADEAIKQAQADERAATTQAERLTARAAVISAQAQRVRAHRELANAMHDIMSAQFEIVQALYNYAGYTVQAAQAALDEAVYNLNRLRNDPNSGAAEKKRAEAAVINAIAGQRDAALQEKLQDEAFLYDLGKISSSEYIKYLQTLLLIPDLTKQQRQDIERQIHQLRKSLTDFQFDIPSELQLPTLYEVRRYNQSAAQGQGYQDNRNININIVANNSLDAQQALNSITDVLSGQSRYGVQGTLY